MLTTNQKGAIAETAVAHEAAKIGIGVYRPLADDRYDFIFDLGRRLVRVQCKWAARRGGVVVVPLYSARRTANGLRRRPYNADEVDAFAAWCPDTPGCCYYFEFADIGPRQQLSLRLAPARNNQEKHVRWARDYEFGATLVPLLGP